ncbi:MAG TPA: sigma-70 family RNA polymerase sigma factor [Thermomicrobiales bacterium]|nr:sigma-70 family RNA polymerase sigma factor [Thermomicrobiales bacterium]
MARADFVALVATYEAPLARYLSRLVGDPELARDLTQETFLSAYRALPATDVACPRGWLFRIATNHALGVLRRRKLVRWVPFSRLAPRDEPPAGEEAGDDVETGAAIAAALAGIAPRDRACLLLHAAGFSSAEIAAQLGCSVGAARTRLSRARETFRRRYHRDDA